MFLIKSENKEVLFFQMKINLQKKLFQNGIVFFIFYLYPANLSHQYHHLKLVGKYGVHHICTHIFIKYQVVGYHFSETHFSKILSDFIFSSLVHHCQYILSCSKQQSFQASLLKNVQSGNKLHQSVVNVFNVLSLVSFIK